MYINIEAERVRRQMSQTDIAAMLAISQKTYSSYVRGITPIPSDILLQLASLFGCDIDYLLTEAEDARRIV